MPIAGFDLWASRYAETFGLDRDSDLRMILAWEALFEADAVGIEELRAALIVVGRHAPRWRSDHLVALQVAIRDGRVSRARAERDAEEAKQANDACHLCAGTGWATVPHPDYMERSQNPGTPGVFYGCSVLCVCGKGRQIRNGILAIDQKDRNKRGLKIPLSLDQYSSRFPNWVAVMKGREKEREAARKANGQAIVNDRTYGQVIGRLRRRSQAS